MWVARDKDGTLNLWAHKPHRDKMTLKVKKPVKKTLTDEFWDSCEYNEIGDVINDEYFEIDSSLFPELKWESEPIEVEVLPSHWTREHKMLEYLTRALEVAEEGDSWMTNDALGGMFCREIKNKIKPIIERVQEDIKKYEIKEDERLRQKN